MLSLSKHEIDLGNSLYNVRLTLSHDKNSTQVRKVQKG